VADVERDVTSLGERGIRTLGVAKTDGNGKWQFLGLLTFLDPPRPDTKQTIDEAAIFGVCVKMITGDHLLIAKETARRLGMGDNIQGKALLPNLDPVTKEAPKDLVEKYGPMCLMADGFAEVFPEHKFLIVQTLRLMGFKCGMTGDGVNDAPALKRADVGIAVNGATDAARAAADIVLTRDGLSTVVTGIRIARCIFCRIRNFITYRIAATLQLLMFFFIAVFAFKPIEYMPQNYVATAGGQVWPPFFHMPVLMLMLITLLNDGTLIAIGYDHVKPRQLPEKWNIPCLFLISTVLAIVACTSSLLLLWFILDSWNPTGVFQKIGLAGLTYGQITTTIFLKVAVSDFLTLFSARAGPDPFWTTPPAPILVGAGLLALSCSTILAIAWPYSSPDNIESLGLGLHEPYLLALWIWIYCIVWWFIQDAFKVICVKIIEYYDIFGYNETGKVDMRKFSFAHTSLEMPTIQDEVANQRKNVIVPS